jgi:hypothetical protein
MLDTVRDRALETAVSRQPACFRELRNWPASQPVSRLYKKLQQKSVLAANILLSEGIFSGRGACARWTELKNKILEDFGSETWCVPLHTAPAQIASKKWRDRRQEGAGGEQGAHRAPGGRRVRLVRGLRLHLLRRRHGVSYKKGKKGSRRRRTSSNTRRRRRGPRRWLARWRSSSRPRITGPGTAGSGGCSLSHALSPPHSTAWPFLPPSVY